MIYKRYHPTRNLIKIFFKILLTTEILFAEDIQEPIGQKVNYVQEKIGTHWSMGIVPYYFDSKSYDYLIARRVRMAMNVVEGASCVRFKPLIIKPSENISWIHITNPQNERECVHQPRYKENGEVELVLGLDCLKRKDIFHTLLHAINFRDEVSHPQRDQYIRILWENIHPEYRHLFRIQLEDSSSKPIAEYDPMSIMHFHDRAFSRNGHATVAPLIPGLLINPSDDLSQLDKMKLRLLFGHECNKRKVGDLLDTCKMALHDHVKQNNSATNSSNVFESTIDGNVDHNESTIDDTIDDNNESTTDGNIEENIEKEKDIKKSEDNKDIVTVVDDKNEICLRDQVPDGLGGCLDPTTTPDKYESMSDK